MHPRIRIAGIVGVGVLAVGLAAASANADLIYRSARISAAQEVPTNSSLGNGVGTFVIDTVANTLSFNISYTGLTSAETAAHIHGPAPRGTNASVLFGLPATNPKIGTWNFLESQQAAIVSGQTYVNIHTSINPGGELRGQIDEPFTPGVAVPGTSRVAISAIAAALLAAGAAFMVIRRRRSLA